MPGKDCGAMNPVGTMLWPPTSFTLALTDEHEALRVKAHEFARDVIRPVASEYDRAQEFPWPVIEEAAQQGLYQSELYAQLAMEPTGLSLPILIGGHVQPGLSSSPRRPMVPDGPALATPPTHGA
jgi:alkylation response protein AidB-like acyl-CoA dehydrogenase